MRLLSLGVVLESWQLPLRQGLELAAKAGCQGVQFDAVGQVSARELGSTARREIKTLLKSYNLRLNAVGCPLRHGIDLFENQHQRIDTVCETISLAYDLGSQLVVLPMPAIPVGESSESEIEPGEAKGHKPFLFFGKPPSRERLLRDALESLANHADKIGVQLALECGLDSGDKTRDYLNSYASGTLRVTFDPANFLVNGHDPITCLMALRELTSLCHGRDVRRTTVSTGPVEVPAGQGDVDWITLIATLGAMEYNGFINVERTSGSNRARDVESSLKHLRKFMPTQ